MCLFWFNEELHLKDTYANSGAFFGTGAYFQVVNPRIASAYKRAVEILSDWERQGKPLLAPKK